MSALEAAAPVTCFTAPGVTFTDRQSLHEHYKSDWHRYNLKRKVAGLPPLPKAQFEARKEAALAAKQEKEAREAEHKQDHVKKDKKLATAERNALRRKPGDESVEATLKATTPTPGATSGAAAEEGEGAASGEEEEEEEFEVDLRKSIFTGKVVAEDLHGALEHMARNHGLFLPDIEFLENLEELMTYLHQKVGVGHCCLYCEKLHRTAQSCRQHMVDASHCKVRYDEQEDMDELSDFYDFSKSEGGAAPMGEGDDVEDEEAFEAEVAAEAAPHRSCLFGVCVSSFSCATSVTSPCSTPFVSPRYPFSSRRASRRSRCFPLGNCW